MSVLQIAFLVLCAVSGYAGVSWLMRRKPDHHPDSPSCADPLAGARWHEVLGVGPDAGIEEIMSAYNHLLRQYRPSDPDALAPEIRALCEARMCVIDAAYREGLNRP